MKPIKTLITILFISLLSTHSWSVTYNDLVERNNLYYKKFTDAPFSGEVTGSDQGSVKNGKKDGTWISYYWDGQLRNKINWKNGVRDGAWVVYHENGQLRTKGNYKNHKTEGAWVYYHENGQLSQKGISKNDEMEGPWVAYQKDGTVWKKWTGTFKNGVKISD